MNTPDNTQRIAQLELDKIIRDTFEQACKEHDAAIRYFKGMVSPSERTDCCINKADKELKEILKNHIKMVAEQAFNIPK